MDRLPVFVYSSAALRAADARATAELGIAGHALMSRAGEVALRALRKQWPLARRLLIVCGRGNNGGDGYVVARLARAAGLEATLAAPAGPPAGGDALRAAEDWRTSGGAITPWSTALLPAADLVVDALLGVGLDREVAGPLAAVIEALNAAGRPVVALDVPSGLDSDSGCPRGVAVRAALTVSFMGLKPGFYLGAGPDYCGRLVCDDLDVPASAFATPDPVLRRITDADLGALLPRRPRLSHKGDNGHVLVIGGAPGMPGAVRLAGEAALRAGAGLVTLATAPVHAAVIAAARPELICHGVDDARALEPLLGVADVVALGPGLGRSAWGRALATAAFACAAPLIVDADALNVLAAEPRARADWCLTPHPGEAARLLGCEVAAVQSDRLCALRTLVARFGATVLLKGAGTLIAGADGGPPWVCERGNPGMAVAGMGDVLTGVIAALAAQQPEPRAALTRAAAVAAWVHASAGDLAAHGGERGILASDLVALLPACVNPAP